MKDKAPLVKTQILTTAEKMFHDYGYNNTTFQQIADEIGITKSTISYHFKNKYLLLLYMIDEYFQYLRDFIDQYPDEYQNAYWRICVMYIYFYRVITSSEKNLDLFYRKDAMDVWETSKVGIVSNHYRAIIRDFHKPFDELDLRMSVCMDLGARRRLYHEFLSGNSDLQNIDTFCYYPRYLRYWEVCDWIDMTFLSFVCFNDFFIFAFYFTVIRFVNGYCFFCLFHFVFTLSKNLTIAALFMLLKSKSTSLKLTVL